MTQRQTNVLDMYQGVLKYLDTYAGVWNAVQPVAAQQAGLKATVAQINEKKPGAAAKKSAGLYKGQAHRPENHDRPGVQTGAESESLC